MQTEAGDEGMGLRIAVMGAGALGGYFGGRLAAAGFDVRFIARGAHLAALRSNGLRVESPLGDLWLKDVFATDDPAEAGECDLALFLVKLYDTETAARAMAPLLGPDTAVLTLQNGVDGWERLGAIVGRARVMPGSAYIPAVIKEPGVVSHSAGAARIVFGELDGAVSPRAAAARDAFAAAGIDAEMSADIQATLWEKFVMLSALSAATTLMRAPIGPIRETPMAWEYFVACVDETLAVGRRVCPTLGAEVRESVIERALGFEDHLHASMLGDLRNGKPLELNDLSGAIVRIGAQVGVPTPSHLAAQQALQIYAYGPPAVSSQG